MEKCEGCGVEMYECYLAQKQGYNSGLRWFDKHCFFFVLDKRGKFLIE